MNSSDYFNSKENAKVTKFTEFLWWCAGADNYFLKKSPKQDRVKYAGIGGIVFCTGVLATISGGFAFYTAFGPKAMAGTEEASSLIFKVAMVLFAVSWGLMIFNLDRFIVSSTGKGDGTDKVTGKEFVQAIPRIFIAVILGIVISKPLELKILETEINTELLIEQNKKRAEFDEETKRRFNEEIARIDDQLVKIDVQRAAIVDRQKAAEQEYIDQMQGRSGMAGYGPRAKQLEQLKLDWDNKLAEFDSNNSQEIESLKQQRSKKLDDLEHELNVTNLRQAQNLDGLLERIKIAHELSFWMAIFLPLVFLSIETGPIFFKMMMTKGAYDYMVENFNLKRNMENGIIRTEHLYEGKEGPILMEKYRYLQVDAIRHEKLEALEAQNEINQHVVSHWKNRKLEDLKARPKDFYSEDPDFSSQESGSGQS